MNPIKIPHATDEPLSSRYHYNDMCDPNGKIHSPTTLELIIIKDVMIVCRSYYKDPLPIPVHFTFSCKKVSPIGWICGNSFKEVLLFLLISDLNCVAKKLCHAQGNCVGHVRVIVEKAILKNKIAFPPNLDTLALFV